MDRWLNFSMGTGQTERMQLYVSSALTIYTLSLDLWPGYVRLRPLFRG